jgi:hypothetical protein
MTDVTNVVPELRTDYLRRDVDGECLVWSPLAAEPAVLDPVATVMLDVIDGNASIGELAREVHEEIGVPFDVALQQVGRIVYLLDGAGMLTSSVAPTSEDAVAARQLFRNPPNP